MKKILFIDRDGTLVKEPPIDFQLDSLEKLEFIPGVFKYLNKIVEEGDYTLVMVTNQDGLGTDSFPEATFWPAHNKILQAFSNEGIKFDEVLIDRSMPEEKSACRKPDLGMVRHYLNNNYDLINSFVIGDRMTDVQFAKNIGCKSIYFNVSNLSEADYNCISWQEIYEVIKNQHRTAQIERNTNETKIKIGIDLDGTGQHKIVTGIGFFDHMLEQIARHALVDLFIETNGDLHVDEHHTIEDTGIALGMSFKEALGNKKGIERYGFLLPMDDALAQVAIDFGGRAWLEWDAEFKREKVGDCPTEMFKHFFKSFCDGAACNLNIKATGENEHHKIESIFKAFAKSIKMAVSKTNNYAIPSTKGIL